jgi:hypothetical protein
MECVSIESNPRCPLCNQELFVVTETLYFVFCMTVYIALEMLLQLKSLWLVEMKSNFILNY